MSPRLHLTFQIARGLLVRLEQSSVGDRTRRQHTETLQKVDVLWSERRAAFKAIEIEPADDCVARDKGNQRRLPHAPAPDVPHLVGGQAWRKMIWVDREDERPSFAENACPWTGGVDVH